MTEELLTSLLKALEIALEEASEDTRKKVKGFVKKDLEVYLKDKEEEAKDAKNYEAHLLLIDDGFSLATKNAMATALRLSQEVEVAKSILKKLPADVYVKRISTSGVHYDML